ncbi:MAG: transketolase C-terminal domain-containing protein, partial [Pelovirga sp.]
LGVLDARFIKPLDREQIISLAENVPFVMTVEENVLQGGFGSAVLELFSDVGLQLPVLRIGIPDVFIEQGSQAQLYDSLGLNAEHIATRVRKLVKLEERRQSAG